jgi:hypothetical protein
LKQAGLMVDSLQTTAGQLRSDLKASRSEVR